MDELLDFELGTEAAVNLRQLAARKKAFDRFIQKAAAFWDHGTHSFESKSRLWTEIAISVHNLDLDSKLWVP